MTIFKPCDIRGVYGHEWSELDALRIGRSLGKMLRRRGQSKIFVGGDFRRTTAVIKKTLTDGLVEQGIGVHDVGHVPTPIVYFAARHSECDNVAVVTASHNPGKYNGVKFMVAGRPALPDLIDELKTGLGEEGIRRNGGSVHQCDVVPLYEDWVLQQSRSLVEQSGASPGAAEPISLRVVADTMEGTLTHIAPRVLARVGCVNVAVSETIDPDFATRCPNPANDANLGTLARRVTSEQADIGIAIDGDGDRVVFVDGAGCIVRPEQIAAILVEHCFQRPTVIFDLKCASIVPRIARASGGAAVMRPSGHGFIKATMIDRHAEMGVEVSGHHFYNTLGGGDDALFTALVVLRLIQKTGKPLADLVEPFGWPAITRDLRIPYDDDAALALETIAASCHGNVLRLDGVRAEYDDGWALARASITEPAMTLRFEGSDPCSLQSIVNRFLSALPDLRKQVLEMIDG